MTWVQTLPLSDYVISGKILTLQDFSFIICEIIMYEFQCLARCSILMYEVVFALRGVWEESADVKDKDPGF